jgi:hypothetical protein
MPNLYRTPDGDERKPSVRQLFQSADGKIVEGTWAGSATEEKLEWWLRKPGSELVQSEPVGAIASKADDNEEMIWGDAPAEARLIFVLEAREPGTDYRLAKMVTTAATPAQAAYFRHGRSALFGTLQPDGSIRRIPPLQPPPPHGPAQGLLF